MENTTGREYEEGHELALRVLLNRLGLWPDLEQELPPPANRASGAAGKSVVYFVYIPDPSGYAGRYLVAKFDLPTRQRKEWEALEELRSIGTPPEMLQPLPGNRPGDPAIVFSAAQGVVGHLRCEDLKTLMINQVASAVPNCYRALETVFEVLQAFYSIQPGAPAFADKGGLLLWSRVFGELTSPRGPARRRALNTAAENWPEVEWDTDSSFSVADHCDSRQVLPNPLLSLDERLSRPVGQVMLSRIHGDLNLGNILVELEPDRTPKSSFLIDFTSCRPGRVQAVDSARLEAEMWRRVASVAPGGEREALTAVLHSRDYLDGRASALPTGTPHLEGCALVINRIRQLAARNLNPTLRSGGSYLLEDHIACLYFTCLSLLKHADVRERPPVSRILLLSAAQALRFLIDLDAGAYSEAAGAAQLAQPPRKESGVRTARARLDLPQAPRLVVGRQNDLLSILKLLSEESGPVTVRGWPGVGKTTLVRALASRPEVEQSYRGGVRWVQLGEGRDPAAELHHLAVSLGAEPERLGERVSGLIEVTRDLLRQKPTLVMVDDVWDSNQALPFKEAVSNPSGLLFTTRFPRVAQSIGYRPGDGVYHLGVLQPDDGVEVIRALAPAAAESFPEETRELVMQLEGLPLALQVAARLLAEEHRLGLPIQDLLAALQESHRLLQERAPEDRFEADLGTTPTIQLLFERTTDRLDEEARERYSLLGVWAPSPATFHSSALGDLWETDDPLPTIRLLAGLGLLEPVGGGWFQIHALLVAHAKTLLDD